MSTTTPTSPKPTTTITTPAVIHYLSWTGLILCPIVILMPPRRRGIQTLGLLGVTFLCGNQISTEYTGVSMVQRITARAESMSPGQLPPKALEMQRRLKEERERRDNPLLRRIPSSSSGANTSVRGEIEREKERKDREDKGVLEKIWMGSEGEDWKKKRDEREKQALEEGRGYGGLIMDQIWEVWNWGKDKNEEVKKIDERVVKERKAEAVKEKEEKKW